jgi:PAS domain S-box-containing protein
MGIVPLLALLVGLGLWAIVMFSKLGNNIDVILRENYQSVLAAEKMKEAIERMDSALLFAIGGQEQAAIDQFHPFRLKFEHSLKVEQNNITLKGERELANEVASQFAEYVQSSEQFFQLPASDREVRTKFYFEQSLPTFNRIKDCADQILDINQNHMEAMDLAARSAAATAVRSMIVALLGSVLLASWLSWRLSRSILGPIIGVTNAARAMAKGDLEQVVPVMSSDELGELGRTFNSMARTIREFRQAGTAQLLRAQKTAQATIDSIPDPVVVVDLEGVIERTNPAAIRILGVSSAKGNLAWAAPAMLRVPLTQVLTGSSDFVPTGIEQALCLRDDGQERFYLPRVLSIRGDDGPLGAAVVLNDVTKFRLVDQLKSNMVATVSHELKTPLTSIQMAVHLMLEEAVGPLNSKQTELLIAARQDSDRLLAMLNDLLDLARIEQGRVHLELEATSAFELFQAAIDRNVSAAMPADVSISSTVSHDLPDVKVDRERVAHVFDNLISNAIAHNKFAGNVVIDAKTDNGFVRFTITDSGEGIPDEFLPRIFDRFFRVPGTRKERGVGLGLAITKEIVESHGGQIEVSSIPGKGSTFAFTLPSA